MPVRTARRVPALVVGGFLGSGKTTLVRRLLDAARREGARVAFVSNELGALGIDRALLGGGTERFVEIAGGCVCCQLDDELYDTLLRLRDEVDPDRVVIETSGVAVPHDVQIVLYQEPLRDWIEEEAVAVVVDAEQLEGGRDADDTFRVQVECADLCILNKIDLADPAALPGLHARLDALNPGVPVLEAVHADVDPRLLYAGTVSDRPSRDLDHAGHARLHAAFASEILDIEDGLAGDVLVERLRAMGALRVKGFVRTADGVAVVQGVGRRFEVVPVDPPADASLIGRVVVIRRTG